MQSALTKRFLQATLRLRTGASHGNLRNVLLAQLRTQHGVPAMNFATEGVQREPQRDRKFGKIKNPDSVNSKLLGSTNINDLLSLVEQNMDTLRNDSIAISLRLLAKLLRNTPNAQVDTLQKDTRYQALTRKAHEVIPTLNERDILDYIFWFRKFRVNRIPTQTNSESITKLQGRIRELISNKALNFRSLINVFYDFSVLNLNSDELVKEIFSQVKEDPKLLTPITSLQILQSCARKKASYFNVEQSLAEFVQRQLNEFLTEFDSDQKSSIFKYLADLEMHINPPKYRTPLVLFNIKRQLSESLEEISEAGIINIMEAYAKLPKDFSLDLLTSIKQLMADTLKHESKNVKSPFLIDFLEKNIDLIKSRKSRTDELTPLFEEITSRLPEDDYLSRVKTIERLIEMYDKSNAKLPAFIDAIYAKLISLQSPLFSGPILECLHQNKKDITPILDKFIDANQVPRMGFFQKLRFYLIISSIESDKYKDLKKELKSALLADPQDTHKFISHISEVELKNPAVEELMQAAVASLKTKKGVSQDNVFYRDMFLSVTNDRKTQESWAEWAKENLTDIQEPELRRLTDAIFTMESLSTEKVFLFNAILLNAKPEIVPLGKLFMGLKENEQFIQILHRQEKNFERFFRKILSLMDTHKKDVKVQAVFSLVKRIESLYIKSPIIAQIAKKAYDICQENNTKLSQQLELSIAQYLMDNRLFTPEEAEKVYEKTKTLIDSSSGHAKFMTYQLYGASTESLRSEETLTKTNAQLEILNKQLSSPTRRSSLAAILSVLAFPPRFLRENQELYLKAFEKALEEGNISTYFDLLDSIPTKYAKAEYRFYYPFLKQLITSYTKFQDKITPGRIIDVLNGFVRLGTKNSYIYNLLLQDIATNFTRYRSEDLVEIIKAFTKLGINQSDLFDQVIQRKGSNLLNYQAKVLLPNLFRVAYKSPVFQAAFMEALPNVLSNPTVLAPFIYYLPILELANELELFEKALPQLTKVTGRIDNKRLYLTAYYLKNKYPNKPELAESLRDIIDDFDKVQDITNAKSYTLQKVTQNIGDYLKAMNVEYQTDFTIDGFGVDVYIPEQKKVVQLLLRADVNFDKSTLSGKADLTKRIYQGFEGYESVILNTNEFDAISEHAGKVAFLVESGIKDNTTGEHDFSHIEQTNKPRRQRRERKEAVAVEEEESDSESSHDEATSETSSEDEGEDNTSKTPEENKH